MSIEADKFIFRIFLPLKNPNDELSASFLVGAEHTITSMVWGMDIKGHRFKFEGGISIELATEDSDNLLGVFNSMKFYWYSIKDDGEYEFIAPVIEYAKLPDLAEWFPIIKLLMDEKISEMTSL